MKRRGFTLMEIIFTLLVATTIFSAVLPLLAKSVNENKASRLKLLAYEAAQKEIENVRDKSFATITNYTFTPEGVTGGAGSIVVDKTVYGSTQTDILMVTSKVTYTFSGKTENIEVKSYIFDQAL